ncbi:hypothetical protein G6L15_08630 [Agrobacterium rhizogenes]|uniref:hypothetical protein n=1 Tax=Rhizobium rhizogenes TaxID=359 RepID=UPI001574DDB5|nr:hypothetical protein [Rhizobium rhizogenes]NTG86210.1 hypothetical protein [Rhizobium rhizogenes]
MGNYVQRIGDMIFTISVFALIAVFLGCQGSAYFGSYLVMAISSLITGLLIAVFGRMSSELTQIRVTSEEQTRILQQLLTKGQG